MTDELKIQKCLVCKTRPHILFENGKLFAKCEDGCCFSNGYYPLDVWNELRLAPKIGRVRRKGMIDVDGYRELEVHPEGSLTDFKDWMLPDYIIEGE